MLSRVAESLYWLGRYIERAENNSRILDVNLQLTLDMDHGDHDEKRDWSPILATLEDQKLFNENYATVTADGVCEFVTFSKENPNSILSGVARTVRMRAPCGNTFPAKCGNALTAFTFGLIRCRPAKSSRAVR